MKIATVVIGIIFMAIATISQNVPTAIFGAAMFLSAFLAAIEDAILRLKD